MPPSWPQSVPQVQEGGQLHVDSTESDAHSRTQQEGKVLSSCSWLCLCSLTQQSSGATADSFDLSECW